MSNRKYYVVDPLSQPADQKITFSGGNTNLAFTISENSNEFYVGGSARITFKFRIIDNNATLEDAGDCYVSPQCGLLGLFSSCDVHNAPTNTLISSVRNMPRLASSLYSVGMADLYDVQTSQQIQGLSNGTDYNSNNVGVYDLTANPNELQSYSVRPISGCLEQDWYLGSPLMNGNSMKITLQLASDGNALTRIQAPTTNYTYELSEVKLVYQTVEGSPEEIKAGRLKSNFVVKYTDMIKQSENRAPSADEVESNWQKVVNQSGGMEQSFSFKDYNNYITTIQSDNATTNLQLGIGKVSSIFANFVESSKLNNLVDVDADSNKTYQILDNNDDPVPYEAITFTKNGNLFPYEYTLSSNVESNNYVLADDYTADRLAQIKKSYLDSVVPYNDNKYQQGSVVNSLFEQQYRPNVSADDCNGKGNGLGTGQLSVLDGSSDFRLGNFGVQINSKNTATFQNTSAFIYALHEKTFRWNNGLVSVES